MHAVASEEGPGSTTRLVLLALGVVFMNGQGASAYPSTRTLAKRTGLSRRSVERHLQDAEVAGWIERDIAGKGGQGWKRHEYRARLPEGVAIMGGDDPGPAPTPDPEPPTERDVRRVFEYWRGRRAEALGRNGGPAMKLTGTRASKVRARLREGYSPEDLERAVDGCLSNPFNVENGHTDLELICRSQQKVEQYLAWQRKNGVEAAPGDHRAELEAIRRGGENG